MQIEEIKSEIEQVAKKHQLLAVALFGSQATGALHQNSDVDIAVLGRGQISFDE